MSEARDGLDLAARRGRRVVHRDAKLVAAAVALVPFAILVASALCSWLIAHGASPSLRIPFHVMCHGIPERCLLLFGTPMPICARCVGIYLGLLAGLAFFFAVPWIEERVLRIASFVAVMPLAIDGLTQLAGLRTSTNPLRMATGLVAGIAFGTWVVSAVQRPAGTEVTAP